jgi:hypothetical protein
MELEMSKSDLQKAVRARLKQQMSQRDIIKK